MSRYTSVSNDIWNDKEFKKLSPIGKNVFFFLLSCPSGNPCGLYRLPLDLATFYIGEEGAEELQKPCKLFKYDAEHEVVFIPNYLKYNTARSTQQLVAVSRSLATIPFCGLLVDFFEALILYSGEQALQYMPKAVKNYVSIRARKEGKEELFQSLLNYAY